jgi:hypothetical protein
VERYYYLSPYAIWPESTLNAFKARRDSLLSEWSDPQWQKEEAMFFAPPSAIAKRLAKSKSAMREILMFLGPAAF